MRKSTSMGEMARGRFSPSFSRESSGVEEVWGCTTRTGTSAATASGLLSTETDSTLTAGCCGGFSREAWARGGPREIALIVR